LRDHQDTPNKQSSIIMALQAAYRQFLDAPNPALLADNASLHYITTLVTFNGSAEVLKHLASQSHQLQKKEEKLLDVIESESALAVEVHTTLEFLTGGGAYLPSLDDNFLTDRVVTFPIVCNFSAAACDALTSAADPLRFLRCKRKDSTDPTELGSRLSPQIDRCHWQVRTQLADSRRH
jgi:hypothetical protein